MCFRQSWWGLRLRSAPVRAEQRSTGPLAPPYPRKENIALLELTTIGSCPNLGTASFLLFRNISVSTNGQNTHIRRCDIRSRNTFFNFGHFAKWAKNETCGYGAHCLHQGLPDNTNFRNQGMRVLLAYLALLNFSPPSFLRSSPISHFFSEGSLWCHNNWKIYLSA